MVRTMKAMASSNITEYEMAVQSLQEYYRTVSLGLHACLKSEKISTVTGGTSNTTPVTVALIFGSDQGLVGRFNDRVADEAQQTIKSLPGETEVWAVGERVYSLFLDAGHTPAWLFNVPNSVSSITPLVNQILMRSEEYRQQHRHFNFYLFHNSPLARGGYRQETKQLFPPDEKWEEQINSMEWPSNNLPQVLGDTEGAFRALVREYLFVSIYKACAESLAAENASRLEAMQRAEKNIDEMLEVLDQDYNRLRQSTIDEELFDVIAGFEALKDKRPKS